MNVPGALGAVRRSVLAIDGVGAKHGGAATVLQDVIRAAMGASALERVVVFCSPRRMRHFELPRDPRLQEVEVGLAEGGPVGRVVWHRAGLGVAARAMGAQLLLCLSGGGVPPRGIPGTTLIQQSVPFSREALERLGVLSRWRMAAIRSEMRASAVASRMVVVQTQTMARWVADAFSIAPQRVAIVEPSPREFPEQTCRSTAVAAMHAVPVGRRLLYVGNASPYKNLGVLPPAMRLLRVAVPEVTLFGTFPPNHPITSEPGVVALPYLDSGALGEAYESATALVMPSIVETVGLPMLEAAACGLPVVAADRPYARDVCAEAAAYFDPLDPKSLAATLETVIRSDALRARLRERGASLVAQRRRNRPYTRLIDLVMGIDR